MLLKPVNASYDPQTRPCRGGWRLDGDGDDAQRQKNTTCDEGDRPGKVWKQHQLAERAIHERASEDEKPDANALDNDSSHMAT